MTQSLVGEDVHPMSSACPPPFSGSGTVQGVACTAGDAEPGHTAGAGNQTGAVRLLLVTTAATESGAEVQNPVAGQEEVAAGKGLLVAADDAAADTVADTDTGAAAVFPSRPAEAVERVSSGQSRHRNQSH